MMKQHDKRRSIMHETSCTGGKPARIMALILASILALPAFGPAALAQNQSEATPQSTATDTAQPTIGGTLLPHDLSPLGMFVHADIVVKAVIIGLAFASLVTWTAFVAKSLELQGARRRARRALRIVSGATTLSRVPQQLGKAAGAAGQLVQVAIAEMRLSANMPGEGVKERIAL